MGKDRGAPFDECIAIGNLLEKASALDPANDDVMQRAGCIGA
jgi:hypothetical protein